MSSTSDCAAYLSGIKEQSEELYGIIRDEQKQHINRWTDEQVCLESFVLALSSTRDLLKQEKLRIHADLSTLKTNYEKQAALFQKGVDRQDIRTEELEVVDLQKQLIELNNRILDVNFELERVDEQLQGLLRPDERPLFETKLLVLTDTKRILQEEIDVMREEIFRRENTAKYEHERKTAETAGWADLNRLEEQIARLEVKIDRAKQLLYFPPVKGYRFTGGSGGVYTAAKDLYISEVSGRFLLSCQAVTKRDGSKVARVTIELAGATFGDLSGSKAMSPLNSAPPPAPSPYKSHSQPARTPSPPRASPASYQSSSLSPAAPAQPPSSSSGPRGTSDQPTTSTSLPTAARQYGPPPTLQPVNLRPPIPDAPPPALQPVNLRPPIPDAPPGSSPTEEQHMLAALSDSPTRMSSASASPSYTPTEQLVQQISRGKQGKGAVVMGLLDGLNKRLPGRHSVEGGLPSPAAEEQKGLHLGRLGRRTMDSIDLEGRREALKGLAHRAAESMKLEGRREQLEGRREALKSLAHRAAESMKLEARKEALKSAASRTREGMDLEGKRGALVGLAQRVKSRAIGGASGRAGRGAEDEAGDHRLSSGGGEEACGNEEEEEELQWVRAAGTSGGVEATADDARKTTTGGGAGVGPGPVAEGAEEDDRAASGWLRRATAEAGLSGNPSAPPHPPPDLAAGPSPGRSPSLPSPHPRHSDSPGMPPAPPSAGAHNASPLPPATNNQPAPSASSYFSLGLFSRSTDDTSSIRSDTNASHQRTTSKQEEVTSVRSDSVSQSEMGELDALLLENFGRQDTARTGVCVTLLGEQVEVYGERGSKVPKITVREVALEVEALLSASFEFTSMLGWQAPDRVQFEVQRLERTVQGANIPLPRTLIKTVLNMVLPKVLTKVALTLLPVELGSYMLASEEPLHLAGEFRVLGPGLASFTTDLTTPSEVVPLPPAASTSQRAKHEKAAAAVIAADNGRQLLNITESQAAALAELFSGRYSLLDSPRPLTIVELCRFYTHYSGSASWHPLCNMWNRALQVVQEHQGVADRLQFLPFMETQVAALVRKPARIALSLERLDLRVDADGAATAVRDYLERAARDIQKNAQGKKEVVFKQPLEVQLEALQHCYHHFQEATAAFKAKFKSAGGTVVGGADKEAFQAGVQGLHYEGPASLQIPIPGPLGEDGGVTLQLKLPDAESAMSSVLGRVTRVLKKLASASVASSCKESEYSPLQMLGMSMGAAEALGKLPPDVQSVVADWQARLGDAPGSPLARRFQEIFEGPVLNGSTIGSLCVHRLAVSLQLDQEQLAAQLAAAMRTTCDPRELAAMLARKGHLFITGVAPGPTGERSGVGEGEGEQRLWAHLYSGQLSQVRLEAQRVMFSSGVSPLVAAKLLHAVLVGMAHQFRAADTKKMAALEAIFSRVKELLSKDALRALVSLSASAQVAGGRLRVCVQGAEGQGERPEGAAAAYYPVYLVNDINLLTALEAARSLIDS